MLFALFAATLATCPVEHAQYALRTMPDVTARFIALPSGTPPSYDGWHGGVALRMDFRATGRSYWWLPWNGGTDGKQNLASTPDPATPGWVPMRERPLKDVELISTDADYDVLPSVPELGGAAPAHFLIPDLRSAMWYRTPGDRREGTAKQFFDLVACDPG